MDNLDKRWATVAAVSAAVVALSIMVGVVLGELPGALWFLVVPGGMLGGIVVCAGSLAVLLTRRLSRS
ncbi:MAG TPA: hypothetical protein VM121_08695 [Acidimicrobiales bacterium]|nr:hypothetical protein [Acidimicrobiales bacterium]